MYYTDIKSFKQLANINEDNLYVDGIVFSTIVSLIAVVIVCVIYFAS